MFIWLYESVDLQVIFKDIQHFDSVTNVLLLYFVEMCVWIVKNVILDKALLHFLKWSIWVIPRSD